MRQPIKTETFQEVPLPFPMLPGYFINVKLACAKEPVYATQPLARTLPPRRRGMFGQTGPEVLNYKLLNFHLGIQIFCINLEALQDVPHQSLAAGNFQLSLNHAEVHLDYVFLCGAQTLVKLIIIVTMPFQPSSSTMPLSVSSSRNSGIPRRRLSTKCRYPRFFSQYARTCHLMLV
jgi:hypothetical protein